MEERKYWRVRKRASAKSLTEFAAHQKLGAREDPERLNDLKLLRVGQHGIGRHIHGQVGTGHRHRQGRRAGAVGIHLQAKVELLLQRDLFFLEKGWKKENKKK